MATGSHAHPTPLWRGGAATYPGLSCGADLFNPPSHRCRPSACLFRRCRYANPDLVSGMFTAIQDFVKDTFDTNSGEVLDTLRMDGDHSVWIEQGDQAIMAIVIRGTPPQELRSRFRELLEKVDRLYADTLDEFDGETAPFAMIKPDLEDALTFKLRSEKPRISPLFWVLTVATLALVMVWSIQTYKRHRQWQDLITQLNTEAGLVITAAERHGNRYVLSGLKDPLAPDPQDIISASPIHPGRVQAQWRPYQSLETAMVLGRARKVLQPPATVQLYFSHGTLAVHGRAKHQWVQQFHRMAVAVTGVEAIDASQLEDEEIGQLTATAESLQSRFIHFNLGQAQLNEVQNPSMQQTLETVLRLQHLSRALQVPLTLTILGHADPTGSPEFNLVLSQQRARYVMAYLIRKGADPNRMKAVGVGTQAALAGTNLKQDHRVLRHVTFRVQINSRQVSVE